MTRGTLLFVVLFQLSGARQANVIPKKLPLRRTANWNFIQRADISRSNAYLRKQRRMASFVRRRGCAM
mgnify:FL=1